MVAFRNVGVNTIDGGGTYESDALAFGCFIGSDFRIVLKKLSEILTSILWHSMPSFPVYLALYAGLDRCQIFYENLWSLGCSYRDL